MSENNKRAMSESNNRRKVAVGVFVFFGLLILVIGIVVIGGQRKTFTKSIRLGVIFDDVQGLQAGNNVWFSGMKVGTVKSVSFYGRSQVEVTLNVEKQAQPHIRKDTKARISTDGLVGNKIVVLSGGSDGVPAVADNDRLQSEQQAGMQEMMSTLQASNGNLLAITDNLKAVSGKLRAGQGTLGELLNDPSFAEELRGAIGHLQSASAASERMVDNLEVFSTRLKQPNGLVDKLISDTTVFHKLQDAVAQLNQAAASASDFGQSLRAAGKGLNDEHSTVGVLLHDEETADNIERTIKNLRVSSQELSDDLEAIQHSFLLRGFFKKKKKDEQ
jgi:phospholipid/cholesterol/gamma-HCH transport system substrate-binding protein